MIFKTYKELEFNSFLHIEKEQISTKYKTIKNLDDLKMLENLVDSSKFFAFDVETSSLNMNEKNLVDFHFQQKNMKVFIFHSIIMNQEISRKIK